MARGRALPPVRRGTRALERRVYVRATPAEVWAALHEPDAAVELFPDLRLGPAGPEWPAAGASRTARGRLGPLPVTMRMESLEARPEGRLRLRITSATFESEQAWTLDPTAGGTRVAHRVTFETRGPLTGWLARLSRQSLEARVEGHLVALKRRAEGCLSASTSEATLVSCRGGAVGCARGMSRRDVAG